MHTHKIRQPIVWLFFGHMFSVQELGGVFIWSTCDSPSADMVDGDLSHRNDLIMVLYLSNVSNPILSMPCYLKMKDVRQLFFYFIYVSSHRAFIFSK